VRERRLRAKVVGVTARSISASRSSQPRPSPDECGGETERGAAHGGRRSAPAGRHGRGEQMRGDRLGQHRIERIAQSRILRAEARNARRELRVAQHRRLDTGAAFGRQPAVDIGMDVGLWHGRGRGIGGRHERARMFI
jgi:hypothetical protein